VLYVLPIATRMRAVEQFLTHTRAIVLVIDPKADDPADPALVRDLLGLTLGEARVAALVGSGLPPREAAARLGIGEETARTALKRVFSKVGVSRQSELTALLTKLVLR
jgi:DNA-binding CsgD family transcriptional regulator